MTAPVRASCLREFVALVEKFNGNPKALILEAGIDYQRLADDNYFFPFQNFIILLELTSQKLGYPDFGLQLALGQDQEILGPVAFLALSSSDVREIINSVGQFLYHYTPAVSLYLREAERSFICLDFECPPASDARQAIEHSVASTYNIVSLLTEGALEPLAVYFRHDQKAPEQCYRDIFKSPVYFNQEMDGIEVEPEFLDKKLTSTNPQLHNLVSNYLSLVEIEPSVANTPCLLTSVQARHMIQKLLPTGQLSRKMVADNMKIHERALHRKLQSEGYTFESLVDEIRKEEVNTLLKQNGVPMSQIAGLLGYSEQSSFNRAFKRWFGTTPKRYVNQNES
jgi:AraC-like DNA-binding protein